MVSARSRILVRAAVITVFAAVVLSVAAVGYVTVSEPGCGTCHASAAFVESTKLSAHADIDCNACHAGTTVASRVSFGYRRVFSMAIKLRPTGGRAASPVSDTACLSCHEEVLHRSIPSRGYWIDHGTCAQGRLCTDCHSTTAHGDAVRWVRTANMSDCLECHDTQGDSTSCDVCHDTKTEAERIGQGAWRITHGANWESAHGMGQLDSCVACHRTGFCARCHTIDLPHGADFLITHAADATAQMESCDGCHRKQFCKDCHGVDMPHPASFVPIHANEVKASGEDACLRCHDRLDCTECHETHVHPAVTSEHLQRLESGRR